MKWATEPSKSRANTRLSSQLKRTCPQDGAARPQHTQSCLDACESDFLALTSTSDASYMYMHEITDIASAFPLEDLQRDTSSSAENGPDAASGDNLPNDYGGQWPNTLFCITKHATESISCPASLTLAVNTHRSMPLPDALQDHTSVLVEYYFKEVCGMMSCYDGTLNPYRTTIANSWCSSQLLYLTTQSMAAACLSEVSPELAAVGRQLRDQAALCIMGEMQAPQIETSSMLALVMLGMSQSWHEAGNLGQIELQMLSKAVTAMEKRQGLVPLVTEQNRFFFYNSLIYWRMLVAFVADPEHCTEAVLDRRPPRYPEPPSMRLQQIPHPQTGLGAEVLSIVTEVATLVRKERKRIRARRFSSRHDVGQTRLAIAEAEELHAKLCAIELPQGSAIVDAGDATAPSEHLIDIAEGYRCMGLLQLYRNFPDLIASHVITGSVDQSINRDFLNDWSSVHASGSLAEAWLVCLALHILDLLENIPISSTSRSIQPLLLVSVCSELRLGCSRRSFPAEGSIKPPVQSLNSSRRFVVQTTDLDVLQARRFVLSRLASFESFLAAKPIHKMVQLVKATWLCMENNQDNVYWIDVMLDHGYETLIG